MSIPSISATSAIGYDAFSGIIDQLQFTIADIKNSADDVIALFFAYLKYYGGMGGLLFVAYLTMLLVNTSLSGSAIGLVVQPWVGLAMAGLSLVALFIYLYFVPKPENVAGVEIKKVLPNFG